MSNASLEAVSLKCPGCGKFGASVLQVSFVGIGGGQPRPSVITSRRTASG
jgi:hypothetical protein